MASSCRTHSTPIKAVMVPLDGSAQAEQAIPIAVHLAKLTGAEVRFASVEPPLSIAVMSYDAADPDALTVRELRDQLRHYLTSKAEAARTTHGVRTEISVLRGTPAAALAAYAEAREVDLIVMTTHGRGGLSRFWLGSVADQLLRRTAAPVLLLRPGEPAPLPQFHSVLIALDESAQSEGALGPALALARTTPGSRVVLVQVVGPPLSLVEPGVGEDDRGEAAARLEHLAHRLRLEGVRATAQLVTGARVAERIHAVAGAEQADLIVVGTHGAHGIERMLLGSVADKVVRSATRPVLVVPCGRKPGARHPAAGRESVSLAESSAS